MAARLMSLEQAIAHNKRVKGLAANEPLERVRIPNASKPTSKADYARELAVQIRDAGLRQPILEYAFDRQLEGTGLRDWRIDLAFPSWAVMAGRRGKPLAVEVDGAVHRIKARHKGDMTKHQALFASGWDLLRVSPAQVRDGTALRLVREALA